jgi:hypothetical protein
VKKSRLKPHPVLRCIRIEYDATEPLTVDEWLLEDALFGLGCLAE